MRTWPLIPLYLVVLLANVAANLCEIDPLEAISKVLLMPTLIACLILNSKTHHWRHWFFGTALTFSLVGDIALLSNGSGIAFAVGMGAFLTAHILYITTFSGILYRLPDKAYALGIPALLYGAFAIAAGVIAEQELVQPWRTAVTVYAAAVACMAAVAGVLGIRGVVGGLMFAVSDAMLATKKFLDPAWLPDAPLTEGLIMLSYGMAQFLLTQGFLRTMHCAEFDAERGKKFIPLESTGV
jgi:uncharacterized membrane protein YhhN